MSQTRKKPVANIVMWVQCFAKYTAAMAKHFPNCTPGFMSHEPHADGDESEVEEPAWQLYDEAYREKMASTGNRAWLGMDVALYQELCGSRPRRKFVEPALDPDHWGKSAPRVVKSHRSVGSLTTGIAVLEKCANSPTCVRCVGVTTVSIGAQAPLLDHRHQ